MIETVSGGDETLSGDPLFHARSVAVVGASAKLGTIGGRPVKYLQAYGYRGAIYPVNPKYDEIAGLQAYASLSAIPGPVDMAILAVPARSIPEALKECAEKGVRVAVIFSSGYAEVSGDGAAAQEALAESARQLGVRVLGPNAMGVMNLHNGLMATFSAVLERDHRAGPLGLVSQSGAYGAYIMAQGREMGLGFSQFTSTGNEADLDLGELALRTLEDPETRAVLCYIEQIRDGQAFLGACRRSLDLGKPLVVIKVGRTEQGARAAQSHTGAMAGSYETYEAVFRQCGALSVGSVEEMLDIAQMVELGVRPGGRRTGILSISGGAGVLLVDACQAEGLHAPELPEAVQARMRAHVPFAGVANPVDFTPQVLNNPDVYADFLEALCEYEEIDTLIIFLAHTIQYEERLGLRLVDETEHALKRFGKPIIVVAQSDPGTAVSRRLREAGIPCFEDPSRAVRAVAALQRFQDLREAYLKSGAPTSPVPIPKADVSTEQKAKRFLAEHGLTVTREALATSRDEAAVLAADIGFPVALKLSSPDIAHKSDIGGVRLGLSDSETVKEAYDGILADATAGAPESRVDGVLVQEMVPPGVELILGGKQDPVFGPMVLCGLGGVFTEVLKDFVMRPAPIGIAAAKEMLGELRGFALLEGVRGRQPADIDSAAKAISGLSHIVAGASDWLQELDLNPLIVLGEGQGCVVADAFIRVSDTESVRPLAS
ncbi:MAG: acetate--CoA ligase family protein [Ectothiorhodospiraceae bacterium]|nr:acetate--CoA ligase family protein [Ectothiorhodospiraceae bacterium]